MPVVDIKKDKFLLLESSKIVKTAEPRSDDPEAFAQFMSSIEEFGLIEPIIVSPREGNGKYEVVAGNRRFTACKNLGMEQVPSIIKSGLSGIEKDILTLIENVQRRDLTDTEKTDGIVALFKQIGFTPEASMTQIHRISEAQDEIKKSKDKNLNISQIYEKFNVDTKFIKYAKMTGYAFGTLRHFLNLLDIDPEILAEAEEAGLHIRKKQLLVKKTLRKKGAKKVHKRAQREALRLVKSADNFDDAKIRVDRLAQDIQSGAFDPESGEFYDSNRIPFTNTTESDSIRLKVIDVNRRAKLIVESLTGLEYPHVEKIITDDVSPKQIERIAKTKPYMIDMTKRLDNRHSAALLEHLTPLKIVSEQFIKILTEEKESREGKSGMMKP